MVMMLGKLFARFVTHNMDYAYTLNVPFNLASMKGYARHEG